MLTPSYLRMLHKMNVTLSTETSNSKSKNLLTQQTKSSGATLLPPVCDPDQRMRDSAATLKFFFAAHEDQVHREDVALSCSQQHSDICAIWDC